MHLENTEQKINSILGRNKRVEADKAWETSKTRRALITIATYIVASYIFLTLKVPDPFLNALVPTSAYAASTLSLPFIKEFWAKSFYKK